MMKHCVLLLCSEGRSGFCNTLAEALSPAPLAHLYLGSSRSPPEINGDLGRQMEMLMLRFIVQKCKRLFQKIDMFLFSWQITSQMTCLIQIATVLLLLLTFFHPSLLKIMVKCWSLTGSRDPVSHLFILLRTVLKRTLSQIIVIR